MSTSNKTESSGNGGAGGATTGAGGGAQTPSSYTRFIPREELRGFSAWAPESFEDPKARKSAPGESPAGGGVYKAPFAVRAGVAGAQTEPKAHVPGGPGMPIGGSPDKPAHAPRPAEPEAPPVDVEALVREARQAGYQDGYRDGLSALDSYKQTQAAQMAAFMTDQVGSLVNDLHARLESLEQQLSGRIAGVALELARQVVRGEISLRPELVLAVAEESMTTLLSSARDVTLRMNPQDHALIHDSLEEQLRARGGRLLADPHVSQGGCIVESDIAVVDASVEARWHKVAAAMGSSIEWDGSFAPRPDGEVPAEWLDETDAPHGADN